MTTLTIIVILLTIANILLIYLRFKDKPNLAYIGVLASLLYILGTFISDLIFQINLEYKLLGVTLLLFSFVMKEVFYFNNQNYAKEKEKHNKLNALLDSSFIGVFVITLTGKIEYVNQTFCSIINLKKEDLVNNSLVPLFNSKDDLTTFMIDMSSKIYNESITPPYLIELNGVKVKLQGKITENGHKTFTGTIVKMEG